MTIKVMTPEHGEFVFPDAGWWETSEGNEGWINEGNLWISEREGSEAAIAEFAKGAWLFVYETKDPETEPRVWASLTEVPEGVLVRDTDPNTSPCTWERDDTTEYDHYGPFVEVLG